MDSINDMCVYFDLLQGLLLDPHLCFTSLAKPTFLDSWLWVFSCLARNVCVFTFDFWPADANTIGYIGGVGE